MTSEEAMVPCGNESVLLLECLYSNRTEENRVSYLGNDLARRTGVRTQGGYPYVIVRSMQWHPNA
ncbi:hypothetical protein PCCS19_56470 [Paenibacillus sp. CCS19]|nr:hypothetical protein PCCS19_56470 [Paenibacillus cellulosilyticus]